MLPEECIKASFQWIQSRHLGLHLPGEIKEIQRQLEVAAEELQKSVSIETIIQIAASAETIEIEKITETTHEKRG